MRRMVPIAMLTMSLFIGLLQPAFGQTGERRILFEEFSTAPCGFCPEGAYIAKEIIRKHPSVIWVTHHVGYGTDSLTIPESVEIGKVFTNFAPGAIFDRAVFPKHVSPNFPYIAATRSKWDSLATAHINDPYSANVEITNSYDAETRTLQSTVYVTFTEVPRKGDIRINLFLVEDNVVGYGKGYDQRNYFNSSQGHPYYDKGDPIVGYVHEHVTRSIPTGAWGLEGIIPSEPEVEKTYSHTFTNIPIDPQWKSEDMDVVAFVGYYDQRPHYRQVLHANSLKLTKATTSVEDISGLPSNPAINVYPNPSSDYVTFRTATALKENKTIQITDRAGRIVGTYSINEGRTSTVLPVHQLPAGMYFYRVSNHKGYTTGGTFVVIR